MFEVLPSPGVERDWDAIETKLQLVKPFAKVVHIDLLDGKFAPNSSFSDPTPFKRYSQDFFFELHMMVEEPEAHLERWATSGIRRFLGHVEQMSDQASFVARAEELGEVGLAIDAKTPVEAITIPLIDLDTVLVMTVKAGLSGQSFLPETLTKVEALKKKGMTSIEVDGGINDTTLVKAVAAGATRCVVTSFLFGNESPHEQYKILLAKSSTNA